MGVSLPLFDEGDFVENILDNPEVTVCGAIVSTDGANHFWLHNLNDLRAEWGGRADVITVADLPSPKQELQLWTFGAEGVASFQLKMPSANGLKRARGQFRSTIGFEPTNQASAKLNTALVFGRNVGNFVIVGKAYVCDKKREIYDQSVYDANEGRCPIHKGGKLIRT